MPDIRENQITDYLRLHPIAGFSEPVRISPEPNEPGEARYLLTSGDASAWLTCYDPSQIERARREIAGLRLGETLSLGPALLLADEQGGSLGGPVIIAEAHSGETLAGSRISDDDLRNWLFLLLALHHLAPTTVTVTSTMSQDAATWWRRSQPAWEACQQAYHAPRYAPLMDALKRLYAIVSVHIEVNAPLWASVTRRPCHGNPVAAHVARRGERLMLIEWSGFGLGDPALEIGRAAALATLAGEISPDQYVRFITDYLAGMRDLRDATLEDRVRVFASVLPLGFCFALLASLAQDHDPTESADRAESIAQISRALLWIQDTLGVQVGDASDLVASLHAPA